MNEAQLRGIDLNALEKERFTSKEHLEMVRKHEESFSTYWDWKRFTPAVRTLWWQTPEGKPHAEETWDWDEYNENQAAFQNARRAQREKSKRNVKGYAFTDAQLEIARKALAKGN
jgi:hypothetical protein